MDQNTVRVLSLDGGGIRGLYSATFLDLFLAEAGLNSEKLFDYFDLIIGTSIGGIQAIAYGAGKSPAWLRNFFVEQGSTIFPADAPSFIKTMIGWSSYYTMYGQAPLENAIKSAVGDKLMSDLDGNIVATTYNMHRNEPTLFSNIQNHEPFLRGHALKASDVALTTSAAPYYFPIKTIDGVDYTDGGVFQNNPALIALVIAKRLFPTRSRLCMLSVGTCDPYFKYNSLSTDSDRDGTKHYTPYATENHSPWAVNRHSYTEIAQEKLSAAYDYMKSWVTDWNNDFPQTGEMTHETFTDKLQSLFNEVLGDSFNTAVAIQYIKYLLENVFLSGPQFLADQSMSFYAKSIYQNVNYYRFQHSFTEEEQLKKYKTNETNQTVDLDAQPTSTDTTKAVFKSLDLANTDPYYLDGLQKLAEKDFNRDKTAITNFIRKFTL